jgi:hypothetical protein
MWLRLLVLGLFCLSCAAWVSGFMSGELKGMNAVAALSLPLVTFVMLRTFGGRIERKL